MANQDHGAFDEKRATYGDTGHGQPGVPADEQGISNRPGDQRTDAAADDDDDDDDDVDDNDHDVVTRDEHGEVS